MCGDARTLPNQALQRPNTSVAPLPRCSPLNARTFDSYQGAWREMGKARPSYTDSVGVLKERVDILGDALPDVSRPPRHDDEVLGPSVFRMGVAEVSLDDLTLPGLYVSRSELERLSFRGTDLHLSTFNWSDIIECDFSGADLSGADLRACKFERCDFSRAILVGADLRGSSFESSTFSEADLTGALLQRRRGLLGLLKLAEDQRSLPLSVEQRRSVSWREDAPEPGGG
jgi:BTB/POZ domain-containing protein KCTD9